jgi:type IV pilus assembly protein PilY1
VYNLTITQNGLLTFAYSYLDPITKKTVPFTTVIKNQDISAANGSLPLNLLFGFAGSTGGSTNIHEVLCFKAEPSDTSSSSATNNQQQTGKVQTNAQAYFSYYDPHDWTGRMTAFKLLDDGSGNISIASTAAWDSQCVLTGITAAQPCITTGATAAKAAQPPDSRIMLTWNGTDTDSTTNLGTAGIPFKWASLPAATEQTTLDPTYATNPNPTDRLSYLRGVRTSEINTAGKGLYRTRDGVLGDIVDSSPMWVGPPSSPYGLNWRDRYVSTDATPENGYNSFKSTEQGRLNVIYVGANDGFLHAFRTGSEDSTGNLITPDDPTKPNDGQEILAYMPGSVLGTIHSTNTDLDYSNPLYKHNFYVDATPGTGDLFFGGQWHTWLVGGLGAGGAAIYALDVTDPMAAATQFSEGNVANVVMGEWSAATITCVNDAACGAKLGNTYGTPQIRRFHNGMWGAVFGNGFGSSTGDAGIFVMTVDPSLGNKMVNFYYFSVGGTPGGNGIAYVTPADLDGDHITDYVYAGDLQGNIWRFDLTDCSPVATVACSTGWGVSEKLFTAQAGQPITTPVVVASAMVTGKARALLVSFGTGQRFQITPTSSISYQAGTQSLYGVWDWNFSTWNSKSASQYASLTATAKSPSVPQMQTVTGLAAPYTLSIANLQQQTFSVVAGGVDTQNAAVTWASCSPTCNTGSFGWYANLPSSGEQIVSSPTLYQQALVVNSTVPAGSSELSCTPSVDTGYTYVISVTTGGTFTTTSSSGTTTTSSGFKNNKGDTSLAGMNTNETGSLNIVNSKEGKIWFFGQQINPVPGQPPAQPQQLNLPPNVTVNRVTWTELR